MADENLNAAQLLAQIEVNTGRTAQFCAIGLGLLFMILLAVILK